MRCTICGTDTSLGAGQLAICGTCGEGLAGLPQWARTWLYNRLRMGHPEAHEQLVLTHRVVLTSASTHDRLLAYTTGEAQAQAVQLALLQHPQADPRDRLHTERLGLPAVVRR